MRTISRTRDPVFIFVSFGYCRHPGSRHSHTLTFPPVVPISEGKQTRHHYPQRTKGEKASTASRGERDSIGARTADTNVISGLGPCQDAKMWLLYPIRSVPGLSTIEMSARFHHTEVSLVFSLEKSSKPEAAKRRKNAAHGVNRLRKNSGFVSGYAFRHTVSR